MVTPYNLHEGWNNLDCRITEWINGGVSYGDAVRGNNRTVYRYYLRSL